MIRIGTSGWSYDHWQGVLYPPDTPVRPRLDYYVQRFDTVEVNSTYYHWPPDKTFANWRTRVPEGFRMTVKAPRNLTHYAKLYQPEGWLARVHQGVKYLGDRLGVLLAQLPPQLAYDHARLAYFLECKPADLRIAIEFRHPSWHQEEVFRLLERYGVAYCIMSGAQLPCILRVTTSFAYVRLHGPDLRHLYAGSYSDQDLGWWTDRIREWTAQGHDVWAYFNNDGGGNAVRNALTLKQMLGV